MSDKNFGVKHGITVANGLIFTSTGKVAINSTSTPTVTFEINSTDGIKIPVGNIGQRPSGSNTQLSGVFRYNPELARGEIFANGSWTSLGGSDNVVTNASGSNTQIQFNDSNAFGAVNTFTFDKTTTTLTIGNSTVFSTLGNTSINVGGNFAVNSTGFASLGFNAPYVLSVSKDNFSNLFLLANHSNTSGPRLVLARSRGSYAAQTVPVASDNLASFLIAGWTPTSGMRTVTSIRGRATETYTDEASGSELVISTTNTGSNVLVDRLIFNANASISVNASILFGNSTSNISVNSTGFFANGQQLSSGGGYYKGDSGTVGLAANKQNIFKINGTTLNANVTIDNGENALTAGPIIIASGVNLVVSDGGRVVIV